MHTNFKPSSSLSSYYRDLSFAVVRSSALCITFFTGMAGLIYEVTWHKYLANLLGSQARAAAVILAVFLGGLCAGYWLFGKVSRSASPRYLVRGCGYLELGIGIWGFAFPYFYHFVWQNSGVLPPTGGISILVDVLISILLMGFPTVLMGGTLPLLTQGLSQDVQDASPLHARVYAINTGGAFLGALLCGLALLPLYGLPTTIDIAATINLIAGTLLLLIARSLSDRPPLPGVTPTVVADRSAAKYSLPVTSAIAVAFLAGFYSITLQVVLMRVVALSMGASEYAFAMIVAAFILMLAVGAWRLAGSERLAIPLWINQLLVAGGAMFLYLSMSDWPYWCHVLRTLFSTVWPNFYLYHLIAFVVLCLVLAIPVGAMGSTMPLLFSAVARRFDELGANVGKLYGWNTMGCVAGALIGAYWLLFFMNLDDVFKICLACMVLSVLLTIPWNMWSPTNRLSAGIGVFLLSLSVFFASGWDDQHMNAGLFRTRSATSETYSGPKTFFGDYTRYKNIAHWDDPNTTVMISERKAEPEDITLNAGATYVRNLKVNGKSDGETASTDMETMRLTAHLPMLFSENEVDNAAVVGFGLGVTAGTLSLYPEVKEVTVVEISQAIREFAHFFDFANHGVTQNPKIHFAVGDAYRVLGGSSDRFSLIISEPSNPWVTGVERLFSKEFYDIVKSRLKPGGMYVQWFHTYDISEDTVGLVLNTFGQSFPSVRIFTTQADLIMLGTEKPIGPAALSHFATRYDNLPAIRESLAGVGYETPESIMAMEVLLPSPVFREYPTHTLEFPKLAYAAGKDFFMKSDADIIAVQNRRLNRPWMRRYSSQALIGSWLAGSGNKPGALELYTKSACGIKDVRFFKNWEITGPGCRGSLTSLALLGRIEPNSDGPSSIELEVLQNLVSVTGNEDPGDFWTTMGAKSGIPETMSLIRFYFQYDSAFIPLSVRKLMLGATSCLKSQTKEGIECRVYLAEALAMQGYGKLAHAVYREAMDDGGSVFLNKGRINVLEQTISEALTAEDGLP